MQLGDNLGITLRYLGDSSETTLMQLGYNFWTTLGQLLDYFGTTMPIVISGVPLPCGKQMAISEFQLVQYYEGKCENWCITLIQDLDVCQ